MSRGPRLRYRVNFGDGSVTPQTFSSEREAEKFIAASKQHGGDPHVDRYFVESWDPVAGWFPVDARRRRRR